MGLRVLFLNPYHGGSHRDFSARWQEHSKHDFQLLKLRARNWKWRMRHGAWTLGDYCRRRPGSELNDVVVSTDMLDLALWKACCPSRLRDLPHILYFHENQLLYPDQHKREADLHFGLTNLFSAALADEVWFNSKYHFDSFVRAAQDVDRAMPTSELARAIEELQVRARVVCPGVSVQARSVDCSQRLRVLWIGRWEWDKGNDLFLQLAERVCDENIEFVVLGARLSQLEQAKLHCQLGTSLAFAGYAQTREEYEQWLYSANVVVSTARHEYFGLAVLEATRAGCVPVVPNALAYPEVLAGCQQVRFYDGIEDAAEILRSLAQQWKTSGLAKPTGLGRYEWRERARAFDARIEALVAPCETDSGH